MNTRLVAYRPATNSSTSDSSYQLDLQEAPNISLNFQFSDIKEPETRKASYSQTFKLPFTDSNNEFFQTWFNVNLTTLVFSARTKFQAVLMVGTVPQFEGIMQLKGVYQKAQFYEVVLMSNAADLFTTIGSQKLRDVFKLFDATGEFIGYSEAFNHLFTAANIENSWNGTSTAFQNIAGDNLRDSVANVQKVMYPISVTEAEFFYNSGTDTHLRMDQSTTDNYADDAAGYTVPITQFRPAIQLKTLLKLIMAKAGFSYTSTFLDSVYFGRIFMSTCNHITVPSAVAVETDGAVDGQCIVGNTTPIHTYSLEDWQIISNCSTGYTNGFCTGCGYTMLDEWHQIKADTTTAASGYSVPDDASELWDTSQNWFTKTDYNMGEMYIRYVAGFSNIIPCYDDGFQFQFELRSVNSDTSSSNYGDESWLDFIPVNVSPASAWNGYVNVECTFDISDIPIGTSIRIYTRVRYIVKYNDSQPATFVLGAAPCLPSVSAPYPTACGEGPNWFNGGMYNLIAVSWVGYATNIYNQIVDIPSCIDDKITQKGFLKAIIERFNLVVIADPDNASNLIIEIYDDYLSGGALKSWTEKLDTSKEIVVKDTTSMQKQQILFSDLEDVDLMNKSIKDEMPIHNVYGKIEVTETNNEFASGEMKNTPLFSPYINQKVFVSSNDQLPTQLQNMAVQYEYTYKRVEGGYENTLEATQPKLFWYNGAAATLQGITIYMHSTNPANAEITAHDFTTYPVCTPYELTPDADGISTIEATTRSLYWNYNGPVCPTLGVFNYTPGVTNTIKSLYYTYWAQYLNGIYNIDARIMECYINLNEVDIFNFKFNDEIFIKDSYWRILNISNYQVGANASTKVTFLKSDETFDVTCSGCSYVPGTTAEGNNTFGGIFLVWCPEDDPDCTPSLVDGGDMTGGYAPQECCECNGGTSQTWNNAYAAQGLFLCCLGCGSLPINLSNIFGVKAIYSNSTTKSIISGKVDGLNRPLLIGSFNDKFSTPLLPYKGDDIVIKYNTKLLSAPRLDGESHRIVLIGTTTGNTRGYAYSRGDSQSSQLTIPINTNMIIRVKGITTVVGGTSSTYILGTTEGFAYYTAFKNIGGTTTQLSTAGGQSEFSIREGANPTTCTLNIEYSEDNNELEFGLDDDQTDTERVWTLTADIDVNRIYNMEFPVDAEYALYQNTEYIQFENLGFLLWN
jgi:hypothetical protein